MAEVLMENEKSVANDGQADSQADDKEHASLRTAESPDCTHLSGESPGLVNDEAACITEPREPRRQRLCYLCSAEYRNPKLLPCFHTYCLSCLEEFAKQKKEDGHFPCPLCKSRFLLPEKGLAGLENNVYFDGEEKVDAREEAPCDACQGETGTCYCTNCKQNYCHGCTSAHQRMDSSKTHAIMECPETVHEKRIKASNSFCAVHTSEKLEFYCVDCTEVICYKCNHTAHKHHTSEDICIQAAKTEAELQEETHLSETAVNSLLERIPALSDSKTTLRENVDDKCRALRQRVEKVKLELDAYCESRVKRLEASYDKATKEIDETIHQLERRVRSIQDRSNFTKCFLRIGSDSEIVANGATLKKVVQSDGEILKFMDREYIVHENPVNSVPAFVKLIGAPYMMHACKGFLFHPDNICAISNNSICVRNKNQAHIFRKGLLDSSSYDLPLGVCALSATCRDSDHVYLAVKDCSVDSVHARFGRNRTERKYSWRIARFSTETGDVRTCFTFGSERCKNIDSIEEMPNGDVLIQSDQCFLKRFSPEGKVIQDITFPSVKSKEKQGQVKCQNGNLVYISNELRIQLRDPEYSSPVHTEMVETCPWGCSGRARDICPYKDYLLVLEDSVEAIIALYDTKHSYKLVNRFVVPGLQCPGSIVVDKSGDLWILKFIDDPEKKTKVIVAKNPLYELEE